MPNEITISLGCTRIHGSNKTAWIESHQSLREHPKLYLLCRNLKLTKTDAVGHLHFLWWWCVDYAPTGELRRFNDDQLAKAAEWSGEPKVFVQALVGCGFLDRKHGVLTVHDWMDFCGELVRKRIERVSEKRRDLAEIRRQISTNPHHPTQPTQPTKDPPTPLAVGFEEFWHSYPKKVAKVAAAKVWAKLTPSSDLLTTILDAIKSQQTWPQWIKNGGQFVPHPATWLNQRRWEDQPPSEAAMVAGGGKTRSVAEELSPAQRAKLKELTSQVQNRSE